MSESTVSLTPTSARERRNRNKPFVVKISPDLTVKMKRVDMVGAFFNDLIPLPMLGAFNRMEEMAKKAEGAMTDIAMGDVEAVNDTLKEIRETEFLEFLRRYACAAVLEPKLVMEDDGNEDHLPVTELSQLELMAIWNAEPPSEPVVSHDVAQEFRGSEQKQDDPAVPAREDVRPEAELVDLGDREAISV